MGNNKTLDQSAHFDKCHLHSTNRILKSINFHFSLRRRKVHDGCVDIMKKDNNVESESSGDSVLSALSALNTSLLRV